MKRRGFCLGLLVAICALGFPLLPEAAHAAAAGAPVRLGQWVQTTVADFAPGTFEGTIVLLGGDGEVRLRERQEQGIYTSVEKTLPFPCRAAGLLYKARVPAGAGLSFELHGRDAAGEWTAWTEVPTGPWTDPAGRAAGAALVVFAVESRVLQYRVTFNGEGVNPVLEEITVVYLQTDATPAVQATPPWREADGWPRAVPAADWGAEPVRTGKATSSGGPLRVEILPAALATGDRIEAAPLLRMMQRFQRDMLGLDDLAYTFLVDQEGGVYQGRPGPVGDVLYIGVVGAHPHELVSPTVEDALISLLAWWRASGKAEIAQVAPSDPLLAERLEARQQAGNFRRSTWVLARGSTGPAEHEWILVANPDPSKEQVSWDLFPQEGEVVRGTFSLPGESRSSLFANLLLSGGAFWAQLRSSGNILVERALYYGCDADDSVGLEGLSREWYLPGGEQEPGFTTTLTLLNPGEKTVTATVTVFAPAGQVAEKVVPLATQSRLDLPLASIYTGTAPVGCRVSASGPIAAEQGVRFLGEGGYGMPGSPLLSREWAFAGVETEPPFVSILAILNPHRQAVGVTLTLMSEDGTTLRRQYTVQPGEQTLKLNNILPELALAARVQAGRPVAVARITFFNDGRAAHATLGAVRPARRWYLPEGATAEPFESLLQVANPNNVPTGVEVTFLGGRGELAHLALKMPAHARLTVPLNEVLPNVSAFSTVVEAEWPVVVERAMYLHDRTGGHASLGIPR